MELDEVLGIIGSYGRYQVIVYLLISFFDNFLSIWHMSVMAFLGFEPEHYCKVSIVFKANFIRYFKNTTYVAVYMTSYPRLIHVWDFKKTDEVMLY